MKKDIVNILAIESSCDETAASVVCNGRKVLSNVVSSQIEIHQKFGGVVPEVASRNHIANVYDVACEAVLKSGLNFENIDAIAVTYGAGLMGALLVGVNFAKGLAYALKKPLLAVSHVEGHIAANYITHEKLEPPFTCLMVSGGHTCLFDVKSYTEFNLIGQSVDDAAGEAFDKVARVLGLPYPGGPNIDKKAKLGEDNIVFKHRNNLKNTLDFSFSGIKTAIMSYVNSLKQSGEEVNVNNICASFQSYVANELSTKAIRACKEQSSTKLVVAGGVSANSKLKEVLTEKCKENGVELFMPELKFCGDNAAMIGSQAYFNLKTGKGLAEMDLTAKSRLIPKWTNIKN
ncbi:MAG: tRNA (adenosine(37)-N6)-threonylcarbamoyltransferase complex transferase subunit TsaD [Clostridia bacterium]